AHGGRACRRTDLCPRNDQTDAEPRMVDEHRGCARSRGAGAGALHADGGFPPRLSRLCRKGEAEVRGELIMHAETRSRGVQKLQKTLSWPGAGVTASGPPSLRARPRANEFVPTRQGAIVVSKFRLPLPRAPLRHKLGGPLSRAMTSF